jgi:arylmalonate decarboxylase
VTCGPWSTSITTASSITSSTFEEQAVGAADIAKHKNDVKAALLPWLVAERNGSVEGGRPAITMSTAVCDGLRAFRARRLAVATAYDAEVNQRLQSFLHEEGFDVRAIRGLSVERVEDIKSVTRVGLMKFSTEVFQSADRAEALLISCGGLRTLELLAPLEERCGVPVVSSLPHALRAGVRLLGFSGHVEGYGRLFALS